MGIRTEISFHLWMLTRKGFLYHRAEDQPDIIKINVSTRIFPMNCLKTKNLNLETKNT